MVAELQRRDILTLLRAGEAARPARPNTAGRLIALRIAAGPEFSHRLGVRVRISR